MYYGRSEDFLAILRAYHSAYDAWPEMLVVGVDVDAFVEHPGPDARLIRHDVLRGQIPELLSWDDASRPYRELISWQQTTASLRSLRHGEAMRREAAEEESFAHDGKIVYNRREAELSRGAYDLHSACEYTRKEYRRLFQGYRRLDPMRVAAWNSLTTVCREHDVELVAFLTPYRTETLESVQSTGQFAPRRTEVLELLEATLPSSGRLADLTEIESFDGDPALFVDGVHPLEANTRRMIDVLLSHAPLLVSKARYAL
ncbi:MAG: hypothetical protein KDA61_11395 [Planctomycetales bacterium]|nr:hypothetical protein [Planctomycetales bacterium]